MTLICILKYICLIKPHTRPSNTNVFYVHAKTNQLQEPPVSETNCPSWPRTEDWGGSQDTGHSVPILGQSHANWDEVAILSSILRSVSSRPGPQRGSSWDGQKAWGPPGRNDGERQGGSHLQGIKQTVKVPFTASTCQQKVTPV